MKRILIINGHPDQNSFNAALSKSYEAGARTTSAQVKTIHIADLDFNPNLAYGYRKRSQLEPDLEMAIDLMKAADHLVWIFPMWWYSTPALLKGFIDRTFLSGITFLPIEGKALPKPLLKGKSARIILTADTPKWYDILYMKRPTINQFKKGTLAFCGIKPIKTTYLAPVKTANPKARQKWLEQVNYLGKTLA